MSFKRLLGHRKPVKDRSGSTENVAAATVSHPQFENVDKADHERFLASPNKNLLQPSLVPLLQKSEVSIASTGVERYEDSTRRTSEASSSGRIEYQETRIKPHENSIPGIMGLHFSDARLTGPFADALPQVNNTLPSNPARFADPIPEQGKKQGPAQQYDAVKDHVQTVISRKPVLTNSNLGDKLTQFLENEAMIAFKAQKWKEAESCILRLLARLGNNASADWVVRLAEVQGAQGQWAESLETMKSIDDKSLPEDSPTVQYNIAMALFKVKDVESAKSHCLRAIDICERSEDPNFQQLSFRCMHLMASIMEAQGDQLMAKFYASQVQSIDLQREIFPARMAVRPPYQRPFDIPPLSADYLFYDAHLKIEGFGMTATIFGTSQHFREALQKAMAAKEPNKILALIAQADPSLLVDGLLQNCATLGNAYAAELLLQRGANIDYKDSIGFTALSRSIYCRHIGVTELLLREGANVNISDNQWQTPLHMAALTGQHAAAKLLIDYGAEIGAVDAQGWTPLHRAASINVNSIAALLLHHGCDVNAKNSVGRTALHLASQQQNEDMIRLLMDGGADIHLQDTQGKSARFLIKGNSKLKKLLV